MKKFLLYFLCSICCTAGLLYADTPTVFYPDIRFSGYKAKAETPPAITPIKVAHRKNPFRVECTAKGPWQGVVGKFAAPVNLDEYSSFEFSVRHNMNKEYKGKLSLVIQFKGKNGRITCVPVTNSNDWRNISVALDKSSFSADSGNSVNMKAIGEFRIYPYAAFNDKGKFFEFSDFKLIKQDNSVRKLKIADYVHITKPSSGEKGNTLTDGDKNNNVLYRQYTDDPDIIFDLGGRFTVDEIKVHANSAPSHNFSDMNVRLSFDKKNWISAGTIHNRAEGTQKRLVAYSFKGNGKPMVGRYVRLNTSRRRSDFLVELSEIEISGHTPSAEEFTKAAELNYDTGVAMPPRNKKDYAVCQLGDYKLYISKKNGVINGLYYKNNLIAERFTPKYTLQTRAADSHIDGNHDAVKNIKRDKDSITVTVNNPDLPGLTVRRTYRVSEKDLSEKIEVVNDSMKERKFLRIGTEVILAQDFRRDCFYEMPASASAAGMFRLPADEIQMPRALTNIPTIAIDNVKRKQVLWHTRYRYNGRFTYMDVSSEEENLQIFKPNGYFIHSATIVPPDRKIHSIENRFSVTDGGMLQAYDEYINLADVKKYRSQIKRPAWLRDVRSVVDIGWDAQYLQSSKRLIKNFKNIFSHRGAIVDPMLIDMDGIWGDWPTSGMIRGMFGNRQTAEELQNKLKRLRALNPNYKASYYTWVWSVFPWSTPFQKHPEWFVTTLRNKAKASWFPVYNINYLRFFGIKESRDEVKNQLVNFIDFYDQDLWYVDGGKSGVYAKCWDTMRIDDPLGQTDFYLDVRNAIQKNNPDRIVFFNHSLNPLGDMGYLESFGGTLTSAWRQGAILMWKFKMYAYKDPLHHSVYIYWLPGIDGAFHNYMSGIGVVPSYNSRDFNTRDIPFISARYEIRQAQLADANISPDWRKNIKEELECMALTQGKNGWIFINPHAAKREQRTISFDSAALGLKDKNKPIYAWVYTIKNAKKFKARFGDRQLAKAYKDTGWIAERAVTPFYLGKFPYSERFSQKIDINPDEAKVLMLSQVPGVILSIENEPSHYYLSDQPGIDISGNNGVFRVNSEYKTAEIGLILEDNKLPDSVIVNGRKVESQLRIDKNMRFAVVSVNKGLSSIKLTTKNQKTINVKALDVKLSGKKLAVNVAPANIPVQIYLQNDLVLSRNGSFMLDLPETISDGTYVVKAGNLSKNITLKSLGKSQHILPILVSLPIKKSANAVNKKVNNIDILSQATLYSQGASFADVESNKAKISAGTIRNYESHFNYACAALEIKTKRYLKLRFKSGFLYFNRYAYEPKVHGVRPNNPQYFGGLILDFGTARGYTSRSAAGLGIQNEKRTSKIPQEWGKKEKADHIFILDKFLLDVQNDTKECWIDLAELGAPADWNGKLFITLQFEHIAPDRSFSVELLETTDTLPDNADVLAPLELGAAQNKVFNIPRIAGKINWSVIPSLGSMRPLLVTMADFASDTKAAWDEKNLYLYYRCNENADKILNSEGHKMGRLWESDGVEFFVQSGKEHDMMIHGIIDVSNNIYVEKMALSAAAGTEKVQLTGKLFFSSVRVNKDHWIVEAAIPWSLLGGKPTENHLRGFNLMRNRIEQGAIGNYSLVPGNTYFTGTKYRFKCTK